MTGNFCWPDESSVVQVRPLDLVVELFFGHWVVATTLTDTRHCKFVNNGVVTTTCTLV
jgi:hypothetical protein